MLSNAQKFALSEAAQSSVTCEKETGIPAALTLAQWALESGWGAHQPGNNCFGIKSYKGCFGIQSLKTVEVFKGKRLTLMQDFATFPTLEQCFAKHALLITQGTRYRPAWANYLKTRSVSALIEQIAPIYSTDPDYRNLLNRVISMVELQQALTAAHMSG
jgi:flagellum-specific peptidoglycan hydrolase FlgJ